MKNNSNQKNVRDVTRRKIKNKMQRKNTQKGIRKKRVYEEKNKKIREYLIIQYNVKKNKNKQNNKNGKKRYIKIHKTKIVE